MDRTRKRLERGKRTHPTNPQPQRRDEVSTNSADSVKEHNWSERIELLQGARKFSPSISGPFLVGRRKRFFKKTMTAGVVVSRNALIEAVRAHLLKRPVQMQKEEALPSM
jgi:hypothetical protein